MSYLSTVPEGKRIGGRAQVEVIGVVLLIGIVSISALGLMLVASGAIADNEAQAEKERVEQSFVQLGHTMATATVNGEMPESVEFDAGDSGAITKTDAGTFTIQGGDVNETITVGAIEYEHNDGTIIAYQAGGVWAERGNQTRMLSAPPIRYDPTDETLTLPVTDMNEQRDLSSGPIKVASASTNPMRNASLVANDTVTLTIESPYYRGWEKYFRESAGSGSIDSVDHTNQTVVVTFGYDEIDNAFDNGATIGGGDEHFDDFESNEPVIGDDAETGILMPEMDPVIADIVADARKEGDDIPDDGEINNGMYYVDNISGTVDYDVDLSEGNVTLAVENEVILDGEDEINVSKRSDGNVLRIYAKGDRLALGGDICVDSCSGDATAIQFYGPSTMAVDMGSGMDGTFEGLLYVASNVEKVWETENSKDKSCQFEMQANKASFTGSLVAYSVCVQSNAESFEYPEDDLKDFNFEAYPEEYSLPPQITYLNVAIHEMDVENP